MITGKTHTHIGFVSAIYLLLYFLRTFESALSWIGLDWVPTVVMRSRVPLYQHTKNKVVKRKKFMKVCVL